MIVLIWDKTEEELEAAQQHAKDTIYLCLAADARKKMQKHRLITDYGH